jgi:hypothetical protein
MKKIPKRKKVIVLNKEVISSLVKKGGGNGATQRQNSDIEFGRQAAQEGNVGGAQQFGGCGGFGTGTCAGPSINCPPVTSACGGGTGTCPNPTQGCGPGPTSYIPTFQVDCLTQVCTNVEQCVTMNVYCSHPQACNSIPLFGCTVTVDATNVQTCTGCDITHTPDCYDPTTVGGTYWGEYTCVTDQNTSPPYCATGYYCDNETWHQYGACNVGEDTFIEKCLTHECPTMYVDCGTGLYCEQQGP